LNYLLAVASALLLILSFPGFHVAWLAPVALTPLLVAVRREARPGRRFLVGYAAGVVYWFGVCYWIQYVLAVYGGLGQALGWAVFLLFCLAKALHMGVFALAAGILMRRWWALPAVAALWVAVEISHTFLGFAWLTLGNAGINMSLPMRLAPYTGVYGISFIFALTAAALALAVERRPRLELAWLAVLPLLVLLPALPDAHRGQQTAVLLQPNISETEDWTRASLEKMEQRQVFLSTQVALNETKQKPEIIVWPEVPAPLYYDADAGLRGMVDALARVTHAYVLFGTVGHTPQGAPLNSAQLVSPAGQPVSRYDKIELVPFGEFVPWPFGFATKISNEVGDFVSGTRIVVSPVGNHLIGTFICYESVFPNLVRRFAAGGAEVLFNVSNDGWFGRSSARQQHLSIVRMRAAENRRWILRSTNDGITATIDPAGRLRGTLPPYREAASLSGFTYIAQQTFYTRHGDWFAAACALLAAALLLVEGRHTIRL
jgi:apolipoprotein N-acyltransferase